MINPMQEGQAHIGDEEQQQDSSSVPASNQHVAEASSQEEGRENRNDNQELQQDTHQAQTQSDDWEAKQAAAQKLLLRAEQNALLSSDKTEESTARKASESHAKDAEWAAGTGNTPTAGTARLALVNTSNHSRNLCYVPGVSVEKDMEIAYPLHRIQGDTAAAAANKHGAETNTTATATARLYTATTTATGASQQTNGGFLADIEAGVQPLPSPSPPHESVPGAHATCAIPRFHSPAAAAATATTINSTPAYARNDSRTQLVEAFLVDEENQNQSTTAESAANNPSDGDHLRNPYNQAGVRASPASTADHSAAFCVSENGDLLPTVTDEPSAYLSVSHPAESDLVFEAVEAKHVGVQDLIVHHKGFLLSLSAAVLCVVVTCVVVLSVVLTHLPDGRVDDRLPKDEFSNPALEEGLRNSTDLGDNPQISVDLSSSETQNSIDPDLEGPVRIFGHPFYPASTTEIILVGSDLTGPIPSELGLFTQLTWLRLSENKLTGTLPLDTLAKLTNLVDLALAENLFTGSVPSELGTLMTGLIHLDLEENQFSGTIPSTLANLSQLKTLNLGNNPITGTIPSELGLMTQLIRLFFSGVEGTFPSELLLLTNLEELSFDETKESGPIPSELGLLSALVVLNLDDNNFSGTLPSELFTLTNLIEIDLEANNLTGTLPTELGLLTMLEKIDMEENYLTGTIPSEIGNLLEMRELKLSQNQLTGTVPIQVSGLPNLEEFNVDNPLA